MSSSPELDEALALRRQGRLDEAVIVLEGLVAGAPDDVAAQLALAEVQLRRGRVADATAALERAEQAGGATKRSARIRGDLAYRAGRYADALACYREAEILGASEPALLVKAGWAAVHLGELETAAGLALRALERDPESSGAYIVLGEVARRQGRVEDAEAQFAKAHEVAPDDGFAYAKLVEARLERLPPERRDREVEVLLRSTGRENPYLLGVLARLRSARGDEAAAVEAWRRRRVVGGDDRFARKMEGYALRREGRLDEAAAVLRSCLVEDPEDVILFRTYVHLERQRGALDELRRTLEELVPRAGSRRGAVFGELRKLGAS